MSKLAVKLTDSIFRWDHNIELLINSSHILMIYNKRMFSLPIENQSIKLIGSQTNWKPNY